MIRNRSSELIDQCKKTNVKKKKNNNNTNKQTKIKKKKINDDRKNKNTFTAFLFFFCNTTALSGVNEREVRKLAEGGKKKKSYGMCVCKTETLQVFASTSFFCLFPPRSFFFFFFFFSPFKSAAPALAAPARCPAAQSAPVPPCGGAVTLRAETAQRVGSVHTRSPRHL